MIWACMPGGKEFDLKARRRWSVAILIGRLEQVEAHLVGVLVKDEAPRRYPGVSYHVMTIYLLWTPTINTKPSQEPSTFQEPSTVVP